MTKIDYKRLMKLQEHEIFHVYDGYNRVIAICYKLTLNINWAICFPSNSKKVKLKRSHFNKNNQIPLKQLRTK